MTETESRQREIAPHVESRKAFDELQTQDANAYLRFISANLCNVSAKVQRDDGVVTHARFNAHARAFTAGDFTILRIKTEGGRIQSVRTSAEIYADTQRRYTISMPVAGRVELKQLGRETGCSPGSMIMMSGSEPLSFRKSAESDALAVLLPADFVEARIIKAEDICSRASPASGLQRLVYTSAAALQDGAASMTPDELQKAVGIVSELVLLALGNLADVRSSASPVRSANLMRAKRIIRARCEDSELTLEGVANECGLSLRYMHNLFQDDGRTFREYIMYERLRRARRMLEVGSPLTTRVTEVSLASGFSNVSHFSTAFRRAFSVAPRDVLRKRTRLQGE